MDDAHPNDEISSPPETVPQPTSPPDDAPARRYAAWLDRARRGGRFVAVRGARLARSLRESYRKHTAWTVASVTGTLGVLLMTVLQLLYVLPSKAAPDPKTDEEIVTGPRDPDDLLPLIVNTGTAPASTGGRRDPGERPRRERPAPEPLAQPTPANVNPQAEPLADGGLDTDNGYQVVPPRKPRPTPVAVENPFSPPAPTTDREPIPARPLPEPLPGPQPGPLPTPAAGPVAPPSSEPVDPLDQLFLGGPARAPENPFAPPAAEPTSPPPMERPPQPEPESEPKPEPVEPPPATAEEPPPSLEPEPITAPPAALPPTGNPPVADDPFGSDPLDNLFTPKPSIEPQRTSPPPPMTAPPAAGPIAEPVAEPVAGPPVQSWPEPPMREAPPAIEPPPSTGGPDVDPLDALFSEPAELSPRPEIKPEPPTAPPAGRPGEAAAPIAVDVLVLPPDDDTAFHSESSAPPAEPVEPAVPAGPGRREDDPWAVRTERDRVAVPRPYRERLTPVLREQIERDRGQAPQSSPVPAEKPSARQLDVVIEKRGPKTVAADVPAKFEIVVRNSGRTPVECVDVDEPVPPTHEVLDVDPPALFDQGTLRWRLHDLKAGESRTLSIVLVPTGRGTIETTTTANVASTISASVDVVPADADRPDAVADLEPVAEPPATSPLDPVSRPRPETMPQPHGSDPVQPARLRLDVVIPERVRVGATCPIVFRVTNDGGAAAQGVRLREFLPEGLTHPLGERLEYIVGQLPPGATKEARLTVTAADPGTLVNEAALQVADDESELAQPAAPVTTPVTIYEPGFRLRREGWREVPAGRPVEFTNHVENVAGRELTGLVIEEAVPEGVEVVRVGDGGMYDAASGTITWHIDRLSADETVTLGVTLRAETPGPFRTEVYGEATDQAAMPIAAHVTAVRRGR